MESAGIINGKPVEIDVNDAKGEFILWMHETTFWGMEVNHILKSKKIPLWTNPTAGIRLRGKVRLHGNGLSYLPSAWVPLAGARHHSSTPPTSAPSAARASLLRPVRA